MPWEAFGVQMPEDGGGSRTGAAFHRVFQAVLSRHLRASKNPQKTWRFLVWTQPTRRAAQQPAAAATAVTNVPQAMSAKAMCTGQTLSVAMLVRS